ncbi:MAG: hypothetical protein JO189_28245 [Deltaproteobacteria bacterium]|nr:hypothetical protein [Deltaproteobacteria bacterium]
MSALPRAALVFPGKRVLVIDAGAEPAVQVLLIRRRLGKAPALAAVDLHGSPT